MATPSNVVPVPKPSSDSYKPDRPLARNALVQAQVRHFHHVEQKLPEELRTGIDIKQVTTEAQASAYIRQVTDAIHKHGERKVQRAR
jgi:hypothetical protein